MDLKEYIDNESQRNPLSKKLVEKLNGISNDIEFIAGVLLDVEDDEDKIALLEYIENGDEVNFEQIILNALWLGQQREAKENNIKN